LFIRLPEGDKRKGLQRKEKFNLEIQFKEMKCTLYTFEMNPFNGNSFWLKDLGDFKCKYLPFKMWKVKTTEAYKILSCPEKTSWWFCKTFTIFVLSFSPASYTT